MSSSALSEEALNGDRANTKRFTDTMIRTMSFVMSKLGAKGVFHNTLLFSGRFLVSHLRLRSNGANGRHLLSSGSRISVNSLSRSFSRRGELSCDLLERHSWTQLHQLTLNLDTHNT